MSTDINQRPSVKRITVEFSKEKHREIKLAALSLDMTIATMVDEALELYFRSKGLLPQDIQEKK